MTKSEAKRLAKRLEKVCDKSEAFLDSLAAEIEELASEVLSTVEK